MLCFCSTKEAIAQGVRCVWHVCYSPLRGDGSRPGSAAGDKTLLVGQRSSANFCCNSLLLLCSKVCDSKSLAYTFFRGKKVGMLLVSWRFTGVQLHAEQLGFNKTKHSDSDICCVGGTAGALIWSLLPSCAQRGRERPRLGVKCLFLPGCWAPSPCPRVLRPQVLQLPPPSARRAAASRGDANSLGQGKKRPVSFWSR